MNKTIYQVDAFTKELFKGNPATVMIVDETVTTEFMQSLAMELNNSETAFIQKKENYFKIRYFTPQIEVPLCGHATLASAHIIFELGLVSKNDTILLKAKGADLKVSLKNDWLVMQFPVYDLKEIPIPAAFKELIGFDPIKMYSSNYDWKIAIAENEKQIIDAKPKFEALIGADLPHLMITSEANEFDYVVRCFAPMAGINEDPVMGSAQCALAPIWQKHLNKNEFTCKQVSARTGILKSKIIDEAVEISGQTITVFKARLSL